MIFRCLLIDDEPPAIRVLEKHLQSVPELQIVGTYSDPAEALKAIRRDKPDLIFLDIQMPGLSGLSLLRTLTQPPAVIFTTAYPEYALEGFEVQALDYLLKPISLERFLKAANRAIDHLKKNKLIEKLPQSSPQEVLLIRADRKIYRLTPDEIYFFQALGDYVKIVTKQGNIVPKETLGHFEAELAPYPQFLRVHRTFIVNLNAVQFLEGTQLMIQNNLIPVSKSYLDIVRQRLGIEE